MIHPLFSRAAARAMGRLGWLRGAMGALIAIALISLASRALLAADPALPWLVAPIGASAVLVFILPASPLSQPWPVLGSHLLAGTIGLIAHGLLGGGWLGAALAVGGAIAAMSLARCLHPPAGGTVLVTALGSPAVIAAGWHFLAAPLGLNAFILIACAAIWNPLTGHSYPHRAPPLPPVQPWPGHVDEADLDAVLDEWDEVLDLSREDLVALLAALESRVRARRG